jgi:hypothetical protein
LDQLNATLSIDLITAEELQKLAPHMGAFTLDKPYTVSKNISIPAPVVATIANWMEKDQGIPDPVKLERMALIPDAT